MKTLVLLSLLTGIWQLAAAQPKPVLLDLSKASDTTIAGIFDEIAFIPLETNRQSVFGSVEQLLVTDTYFIILDTDTDAILFFDKQGKFITKYKNKLTRYRINCIRLDRTNNTLLIFSQNRNYTITAAKLQNRLEKNLPKMVMNTRLYLDDIKALHTEAALTPAYLHTNPVCFGSGGFAYSFIRSDAKNTGIEDHELKVVQANGAVAGFFPYNTKTDSLFYGRTAWQCSLFPTLSDSVLFLSRPFQPFIYMLKPHSVIEAYQVAGPEAPLAGIPSMPEGFSLITTDGGTVSAVYFAPTGGSTRGRTAIINDRNTVNNFINRERFLFFNIRQPVGNYQYYIFDKKENKLYNRDQLQADSSSYIFPLNGPVLAFDEKNMYQSLSARALLNMKKGAAKLKLHYEKSLARFYNTGKMMDNPVIIRLKPKEN